MILLLLCYDTSLKPVLLGSVSDSFDSNKLRFRRHLERSMDAACIFKRERRFAIAVDLQYSLLQLFMNLCHEIRPGCASRGETLASQKHL